MRFNSKTFSLIISVIVGVLTTIFLTLIEDVKIEVYIVAFSISLGSSFILSYFTLQFFVFREIEKLKANFESFKKKEISQAKKLSKRRNTTNPIQLLGYDMQEYAYAKQLEIEQLKKEEEFRRNFLADVAHELKTPIFAAQGFVHTLLDGAISDDGVNRKFLNKSAKSLDNLENLVSDLMTISQLESGNVKLEFEYLNLTALTKERIELLEHKAAKKNTAIKFSTNQKEPIEVFGDIQRLGQTLTNLIDNAIKYGNENGTIEVILKVSSGKKKVRVIIKDDGPGMDNEHLSRIFERFYRIDKSRSRETGGTGLGLAIVKHILEVHESKINVESELGKGTKFTFALPLPKHEKE